MQTKILKNIIKISKDSALNISKQIQEIALVTHNTKIAITGLSHAGKTVFITSLIDQILYQDKLQSLTLSNSAFKVTIKSPLKNFKRFDYYTIINQLKNEHIWPKGTDEISHTLLEFETKSHFSFLNNSKFTLEIIDYPGEWLLDLNLLELDYKEWSAKTLEWLQEIEDEKVRHYLNLLATLDENSNGSKIELELHYEYKELLIYLKKNHYSLLTPGRFIMPSDLKNDPILDFAPLPESATQLAEVFEKRYNRYVKEVIKEIHLEHFKGFHRQIVLVDVVEALQNGYQCYKDMKAGLKSMLYLYDHKNKNFISQWFTPSIKKVVFVATKADQVAASQHANFSKLLEDMIQELRHDMNISHIKTETQVIASLKSTLTIEKKYEGMTLSFIRGILEEDSRLHDLYPGEMPSNFPNKEEWNRENYGYKNFLPPKKSYREHESLEHINMDKVIQKIIGDLL